MASSRNVRSKAAAASSQGAEVQGRGDKVFVPQTVVVRKAERLEGTITAPPSKSYSHRALMIAGLCDEEVFVENPLRSDDIEATADAWRALGAEIRYDESANRYCVRGIRRPFSNKQPDKIYVKESGTTLRFLLPGLAFATRDVRVEGKQSLKFRPNRMIVKPLQDLGVSVEGEGIDYKVPITVRGQGFLPTGEVVISGSKSSQVVSAFLLWLPLASPNRAKLVDVFAKFVGSGREPKSLVRVDGELVSKPYVDITIDALQRWAGIVIETVKAGSLYSIPAGQTFTAASKSFVVNGDYSSAAFVLAAGCLCNANIVVNGLRQDEQGDRAILSILKRMGASIDESEDSVRVSGSARLRGVELDCSRIPDLVPILCVLGTFAEGQTVLKNISHLRYKETDRLKGPTEELRKLGAKISHSDDSITIERSQLVSGRVSARQDHRMAMSLMVAGLAGSGVEVEGANAVRKSYPSFVKDMTSLGAQIEEK